MESWFIFTKLGFLENDVAFGRHMGQLDYNYYIQIEAIILKTLIFDRITELDFR